MLDGSTKVYKVKLYDVGMAQCNVTKEDIGENDASIEEVRSSHVFDNCPDDCDISMIVGEFPSSPEKVLLNLRFHKAVEGAESLVHYSLDMQRTISVLAKDLKRYVCCISCYFIEVHLFNQLNHHLFIISSGL